MSLSILCITKCEPHAERFIMAMRDVAVDCNAEVVIGFDYTGGPWPMKATSATGRMRCFQICSDGHIESVLDQMIAVCSGDYVLRLDDDERVTVGMAEWLRTRQYQTGEHWALPRMNLWGDERHYIANPPLWPDLQTRLSVKAKAGGRAGVHDGSPFGTGTVAPVAMEHHKFLIRSRDEREAQAAHYESLRPGAGSGHYLAFSVPEAVFPEFDLRETSRDEVYV